MVSLEKENAYQLRDYLQKKVIENAHNDPFKSSFSHFLGLIHANVFSFDFSALSLYQRCAISGLGFSDKKVNDQDYESIFFKRPDTNARDGKTVYIRHDFHEKLSRIVQVIGEDKITIYAYLDNLLEYHFQEFGEQITASFNNKYKPIL